MEKITSKVHAKYHEVTISNDELRELLLDAVNRKFGNLGDNKRIDIESAMVSCRDGLNVRVNLQYEEKAQE